MPETLQVNITEEYEWKALVQDWPHNETTVKTQQDTAADFMVVRNIWP
jgi:hypothetical protein